MLFEDHEKLGRILDTHRGGYFIGLQVGGHKKLFGFFEPDFGDGIREGIAGLLFKQPAEIAAVDMYMVGQQLQGYLIFVMAVDVKQSLF